MSILIRGMKMPTGDNNITLFLYPDGKVVACGMLGPLGQYKAIPVPPHGRLIDADALVADLKGQVERLFNLDAVSESDFFIERNEKFRQAMWKNWCESFYEYLSARPTVIEAEEGNTWI